MALFQSSILGVLNYLSAQRILGRGHKLWGLCGQGFCKSCSISALWLPSLLCILRNSHFCEDLLASFSEHVISLVYKTAECGVPHLGVVVHVYNPSAEGGSRFKSSRLAWAWAAGELVLKNLNNTTPITTKLQEYPLKRTKPILTISPY